MGAIYRPWQSGTLLDASHLLQATASYRRLNCCDSVECPRLHETMKLPYSLLILLLAACSGKPYVVEPQPDTTAIRTHIVYVVSHGWHAGLVVPGRDVNYAIPELGARFGDVAYYELGWGDTGFYQSREITTGLTLQAMFWSEGAVMHVVAVPRSPSDYFPGEEIITTCLTDQELASLQSFLADSFARDQAGRIRSLKSGIYGVSQFYEGVGRYYLLNTCNKWTAKALRSSGLDITPTFRLTSRSVMNYLATHQNTCSNLSP
jgi:uncharacterized protein (TIGR02117 family)